MRRLGIFLLLFTFALSARAFSFFQSPSDELKVYLQQADNLDADVLKLGMTAYEKLHTLGYDPQEVLTIIDYSKPSTEPRLWVLDLKNKRVTFQEWVAHGKNSGGDVPHWFSNQVGSEASSIGVYLTGSTYSGAHGLSLKLNGLEEGFNSHAAERAIVMHPADYVNLEFAKTHGRLGKSWGCPAIRPSIAKYLIDAIKNGTVLFAYYPDKHWLQNSNFLHS